MGVSLVTIKKRADFVAINNHGQKFITRNFIILRLSKESSEIADDTIYIGYTVTKKIGNAVVRNQIKRRFREVAREVLPEKGKAGVQYVMIARHGALHSEFGALLGDLRFALTRLEGIKKPSATLNESKSA